MSRPTHRQMRVVVGSLVAIVGAVAPFTACSDKALLPSPSDDQRVYTCDDVPPLPARVGGDTFAELYRDVFSVGGVAGCQTSTCHGNTTGPGGNGMAMYPPKAAAGAAPPTRAEPNKPDDRGLYCGITSHLVRVGPSTKVAVTCRGTDCTCRIGDDCQCGAGPNKGTSCCNPKTDTDSTTCFESKTRCDDICRKVPVMPHPDKADPDSTPDSDILRLLSPSKDGEEAFMPLLLPNCGDNRKLLPDELARIASWLKRGAPYDGPGLIQPAYECPPPVLPAP